MYTYGMKARGFSPGCQPMNGLVDWRDDDNSCFFSILTYSRRLTKEEEDQYELIPLCFDEKYRPERAKETLFSVLALLPHTNDHRIWSDGEEILCETEQLAEHIADLIDAMYGGQVVNTGYYDPEEDERNNEVAENTGFWYVTID